MATTSRSHRNDRDRRAFQPPHSERPRPNDPGADEDVPSDRETDEGREGNDRRTPADAPTRDVAAA